MEAKLALFWRAYPMVMAAIAAIVGVVVADFAALSVRFWLSSVLFSAGLYFCPPLTALRHLMISCIVLCLFGMLHARQWAQSFDHPLHQHLATAASRGGSVDAVLLARVLQTKTTRGELLQVTLSANQIRLPAMGVIVEQEAKITTLLHPEALPKDGGWLEWRGQLRPLRVALNPGQFAPDTFALRQGIVAEFESENILPPPTTALTWPTLRRLREVADACRESIRQRLAAGMDDQPDRLTVIQAMVLGASEDTDPRVEESFRRSGTLHVFAVSGLHVGLICVIGWWLLRPLIALRRYQVVLLLIALVVSYAYVTGWRPSAARAAIMITILLGATLVQRQSLLLNGMGLAATLLLVVDTQQLFNVGFQLSFGVLLAIHLLAAPFQKRLEPWTEFDPFLPPSVASNWQHKWRRVKRYLAALAAVSAAAWLGSLPLMIYHFQTVTPAALLANCLLIPLAFLCLGTACISLGASLLPVAGPQILLNQLCGLFAQGMLLAAGGFANLPGASFHLTLPTPTSRLAPVELRVFALPNGGEAALLAVQDKHWMLDCGHQNAFNSTIHPSLRKAGVNRLEGLILSHADAAHVGGAEELMRLFPIRRLYHPLHEPWASDSRQTRMRHLLEITQPSIAKATHVRSLQRGDGVTFTEQMRPCRMTVLYPTRKDRHNTADDRGIVALIELGALRILWLADAGFITESALLTRKEDLRCHILIRGQHATDITGTYDLLAAAAPQLIISCGAHDNPTLKLPQSVIEYTSAHRIPLLPMPESGGIQVMMESENAEKVAVKSFANGATQVIELRR